MLSSYKNDPVRLAKAVEQSIYKGNYFINTPGQGTDLPFQEDPRIRLQHWGANRTTNTLDVESDLRGLTRTAHNGDTDEFSEYRVRDAAPLSYPAADPFVQDSRITHPAFMYRTVDTSNARWAYPWTNPQNTGIELPPNTDTQTRLLSRDYRQASAPAREEFSARDWLPLRG